MLSCLVIRSRSVVPPIPRNVSCESCVPGRNSTPSSARLATILGSLMCMLRRTLRMLRSEKNDEFIAGAADVACANGQDGVAGNGLPQQKFDALLHGTEIVHVFVPSIANGIGERFAGDARDG